MLWLKKLLFVLLVASGTAFAGGGVGYEFERERGNNSPHTFENTFSVAPYYKFENGVKADIQFGWSRDDGQVNGNNNPSENSVEARVQKMWEVFPNVKLGARTSIGELFSSAKDFSYYTIEPKASYALTNDFSLQAAYRYRNAFNTSNNYQTRTTKLGFDYAVTKNDEVGVRYLMKRGDSDTNGVEVAYTRSF